MTELFTRHSYLESVPYGLRIRQLNGTTQLKIEFDNGTEDIFLGPAEAKSLHAMLGDLLGVGAAPGPLIYVTQDGKSSVFTLNAPRSLHEAKNGELTVVRYASGSDENDNYVLYEMGRGVRHSTQDRDEALQRLIQPGVALKAEQIEQPPLQPTPPEPLKPIYSWKEPGCDGEFITAIKTDSYQSLPPGSHYARDYFDGKVRVYRKGAYAVNIHAEDRADAIAKLRQLTQ